ncbi:MAG: aminotransferase class I/II-fold pyridoxal phosphate-dependent enzyme [Verrucomicrobiales bacterium]|nr:aminotransferase class I/II-fold pyridoxal phosphate-dependent enzyme [Verrucomicrobiales bacterium]
MNQAEHGGDVAAFCQQQGFDKTEVLDFSSNLNWFLEPIEDASWLRWKEAAGIYGQAAARGVAEKIADLYAYQESHVLPTAGAIEAIYLAAQLFEGRRVLIGEPGFADYQRAFRRCETKTWNLSIDDEEALPWAEVVIFGSPNNPTGVRYDLEEWRARWPGKIWLVDETFVEFSTAAASTAHEDVIIFRSFTKSWRIPGLRLGYLLCANSTWMKELSLLQAPWSVSALAQAWAADCLNPSGKKRVQDAIENQIAERDRLRDYLQLIPGVWVQESEANFLLLELLRGSAADLWQSLAEKGLMTRKVDSFAGLRKDAFLRIAVRTSEDNQVLLKAVQDYFEGI